MLFRSSQSLYDTTCSPFLSNSRFPIYTVESAFTIVVPDTDVLSRLCGTNDCNLRLIEEHLGVPVFTRGNELSVSETDPDVHRRFKYIIDRIVDEVANGNEADDQMVTGGKPAGAPVDAGGIGSTEKQKDLSRLHTQVLWAACLR